MKETIVQQCLYLLKRDYIKSELKRFFSPVVDLFFNEINPYMYITLFLVFSIFIMNLAILVLLILVLRNKTLISKIF